MANTELFKKIRDQIKANPKSFYMEEWSLDLAEGAKTGGDWVHWYHDVNTGKDEWAMGSECGTIRCVAGWAIYFEAERLGMNTTGPLRWALRDLAAELGLPADYPEVAGHILGIDDRKLFFQDESVAYEIVNEYAEGIRD